MATFEFEGLDAAGVPKKGRVRAESRREAVDGLKAQGIFPSSVLERGAPAAARPPRRPQRAAPVRGRREERAPSSGAGFACERCDGAMARAKVFRMSGCLVAIGFMLLIPGVLFAGIAAVTSIIGTMATGAAVTENDARQLEWTTARLREVEGLPPSMAEHLADDFARTRAVDDARLARLSDEQRREVQAILETHAVGQVGAAAGTGLFAVFGTGLVLLLLAISIPSFIIGLLLILRRKVWRCIDCGSIFDRA